METLLTDTQKQVVATEERLNNVVAGQVQLSDEVAKLKADLMQEANKTTESLNQFQTLIQEQRASLQALKEQVHAQQSSIESHQSQLAAHGGQVTTQEDRLIELQNAIVKIDQNLLQQQTDIDRIWNWIAEKELVFSMLVLDQEFQDSIKELSDAIAGLDQEHQLDLEQLQTKIDSLTDTIAKADGEIIRAQEQLKIQLDNLSKRNQEIESDIQNLSMMLKQEYGPMITELEAQVERLATQVGISEEELANLNKTISDEIAVQMNAALIRDGVCPVR